MMLLNTPEKARKKLAENTRRQRLEIDLTQEGLAKRSGVPLPTLRQFEQKHSISLESFLKIQMVLGGLDDILKSTEITKPEFTSIDEVLEADSVHTRKRGRRK